MTIHIHPRKRLAVWYQCPQCKATSGHAHMTPSKRNRDYIPVCLFCDVQETIIKRRYYMVWACDFYGYAGTCEELCEYYFPNIRAFKRWLAEKTAEREKEAREYYERQRIIQAEYEARLKRQREEAALLKEAEQVVYQVTHAVEREAEQVAKAVWPEEEPSWLSDESLDDSGLDDHPF